MPLLSRLSLRVFLLVAALVTTCGALVHLPGLVAFRTEYLEHRLIDAYMATLALRAGGTLTAAQTTTLLERAHLVGIEVRSDDAELQLGTLAPVERDIRLDRESLGQRLLRTLQALFDGGQGLLRVSGAPAGEPGIQGVWIAVTLDAAALRRAVRHHASEALWLSLAISLFTAGLVQLGLIRLLLRPVGRLTAQLASFQADPYHTPPPRPTSTNRRLATFVGHDGNRGANRVETRGAAGGHRRGGGAHPPRSEEHPGHRIVRLGAAGRRRRSAQPATDRIAGAIGAAGGASVR